MPASLARANLDVFLRDRFRRRDHQRGRLRLDAKRIRPAVSRRRSRADEKARAFRGKMRDVTEFLDELGLVAPLRELPLRVTYQDSCHLAHGQKIREAPRRLIRAIPGVELTEMRLADHCCGSAGVYNVTQTRNFLAVAGGENALRRGNQSANHRHRESGLPAANARRQRDPQYGTAGAARRGTARPRPRRCPSAATSRQLRLLLANKVAASRRPHPRRMNSSRPERRSALPRDTLRSGRPSSASSLPRE